MGERRETRVRSLVAVGILSALVFVFSWVQVPFGDVARIHLGNGFCALAGLLFGPVTGGLASGIGSMLFDLTDPVYIAESPITFVTKFAIGFVAGCIARRGAPRLMRDVAAAAAGSFTYVALYLAKSLIVMLYIEGQARCRWRPRRPRPASMRWRRWSSRRRWRRPCARRCAGHTCWAWADGRRE